MIFVYSESFAKPLWGMNSQPAVRQRVDVGGDRTFVCLPGWGKRDGQETQGPESLPDLR